MKGKTNMPDWILPATFVVFVLLVIFIVFQLAKQLVEKKKIRQYETILEKKESERGTFSAYVFLRMTAEQMRKLKYPEDFHGYTFLVKESEGLLHFNYPDSPQLELLKIEYRPKYSTSTSRVGNSNSQNRYYETTKREINTEGLLTFLNVATDQKFNVKVVLNEKVYMNLKADFLKL